MDINKKEDSFCALCGVDERNRICRTVHGKGPVFCPTINQRERIYHFMKPYDDEDTREFARNATIQEAECFINRGVKPFVRFPVKPRIQETYEFTKKMGYQKIGLAFCAGLFREATLIHRLFESKGFEMVSVVCKVGGIPKEYLGILEDQKIRIGAEETMCNPIAQAEILNAARVDFALVLGLCVGHDSLFIKHVQSPVTVLAVKDRVLGHNPLGALYTLNSYYSRLSEE